jgi:surface carbohydrate biosynthesis protein (TIGR04326 family)
MVVGPGRVTMDELALATGRISAVASPGSRLDVLLFQEAPAEAVVRQIDSLWQGEVRQLGGAKYLAKVDEDVRESISEFVANVRERLVAIAHSTGGRTWADRFGSLWWKTAISEKNSPTDPSWWQFFRAAALKQLLQEQTYSICVAVGDTEFAPLMGQVTSRAGVRFAAVERKGPEFKLHRVIAIRTLGLAFLTFAIIVSKWHHWRQSGDAKGRHGNSGAPLLYSWYPRVWTNRLGGWKDMYHGDLVPRLAESFDKEPVLALRIFDRTKYVTPGVYLDRIRRLGKPGQAPNRYIILESFGRVLEVLRNYLSPRDALKFRSMTRNPDFDAAFVWEGLDMAGLLRPSIWRSVLVAWPHLLALQNTAKRAVRHVQPSVAVVYCFEFVYGRSLIEGTRLGGPDIPVVGLQHGPISPMKLLYSGTHAERIHSPSGGAPIPEPDIYALDGQRALELMHGRGIPMDRLKAEGTARFDDVWAEARRLVDLQRNTEREKTRILIAPGLHDTQYVLAMALSALGQDPGLELVIKAHPKVSVEDVTRWVGSSRDGDGKSGATINIVREGSIYKWMAMSDIFLATYSSTAVEALAFDLPVILLVPNHTPDMSLFHGHRVKVLRASNPLELGEHVARLSDDEEFAGDYVSQMSGLLDDVFGPRDSHASLRLAGLCAEMASRSDSSDVVKAG